MHRWRVARDAGARVVKRWRPHDDRPEALAESLAWQPSGADAALVIDLASLFREALDG